MKENFLVAEQMQKRMDIHTRFGFFGIDEGLSILTYYNGFSLSIAMFGFVILWGSTLVGWPVNVCWIDNLTIYGFAKLRA